MRHVIVGALPLVIGAVMATFAVGLLPAHAQTNPPATTTAPAPPPAPAPTAPTGAPAPTTAPAPAAAPAPPKSWWDAVNLSGYLQAGITGNPAGPSSGINFGRLFDDKSNQVLYNQGSLIFERPVDTSDGFDWGFRFWGMQGTDARYTHFDGEADRWTTQRVQYDLVEADVTFHLPVVTAGGAELKIGQFPTLLGAETIDPRTNYFYSHSYIFNFGLPLKDTGAMLVTHVNPLIDIYTGVITGVNTAIGYPGGDNNGAIAFEGGVGFNVSDALTILASTNIGPEDSCGVPGALYSCNSTERVYGDLVATWKVNPKLTAIGELNIVHDGGPFLSPAGRPYSPTAGGAAGYLIYQWTDQISFAGRAEIFRDANGFFVQAFPGSNLDFINCEFGVNLCRTFGPEVPTTYGEFTIGFNYKPPITGPFKGFVIRPEFRFDGVLAGPNAFDLNKQGVASRSTQETLAVDFILPF
jgi:Putative beta-barrel porin-2, OmpL-like. bbp2